VESTHIQIIKTNKLTRGLNKVVHRRHGYKPIIEGDGRIKVITWTR